jgi:nucleoside-diphosphate-sugar epimerase
MAVRVFLAGATGVIGRAMIPPLIAAGHEVAGMTRSASKADQIIDLGARPVVCDVYDRQALIDAVAAFAPDAIVDQLTDLPDDAAELREYGSANARIRREGTRNLLAAAGAAGVERFLVQSVAWELPGDGAAAVAEMEQLVLDAGGVVVRYGQFYGPSTYHEGRVPSPPRIAVDSAASRTVVAIEAASGIVTIVDDD